MIDELRPLVTNAIPVLHNLASAADRAARVLRGARTGPPQSRPRVAQQNANYYIDLDKFFTDWASVAHSIEEANIGGPPSLEQAIYSLPHQAALLRKRDRIHEPAAPEREVAGQSRARTGRTRSASAPPTSRRPRSSTTRCSNPPRRWRNSRRTRSRRWGSKNSPTRSKLANPLLAGIAPSQGFCNYWTLAFRNLASLDSENIGVGTLARAGFVLAPSGPNNEGYPASAPPTAPSEERHAFTQQDRRQHNNHLHANLYPNTAGPGQPQVCEAGNETYIPGQTAIGQPARRPT